MRVHREIVERLEALPTLTVGQAENQKIETTIDGRIIRVWLSRLGPADGMPHANDVTVETWDTLGARGGPWRQGNKADLSAALYKVGEGHAAGLVDTPEAGDGAQ